MERLTDETQYLQVTTPLDGETRKFVVARLEGEESLSGLFHYRLALKSWDGNVDFSSLLGQTMTVSILQYNGTKRYINGICYRFIQAGKGTRLYHYFAELRPWTWQLTLTANCMIFQQQTVNEIVAAVFDQFGFSDFKDLTNGSYTRRDYCVQYEETAYNFVARLLEEEGIFWFFEHDESTHTLVLADDGGAHQDCPGESLMRWQLQEWEIRDDIIHRLSYAEQLTPNEFASDDFNFEIPDTDLLVNAQGPETGNFRVYEYPGRFAETGQGENFANRRMEIHELEQKLLRGEGLARSFIAGYRFTLSQHEREDLNRGFVLKQVAITATPDRYLNQFEAFPDDVPFRPPRVAKKPRIYGTQTAIVTGKSGEEIWPDAYGRVKVQFHWDQEGKLDENSSCWVRVAQVWAGKNWGTFFVPRIGMEVVVSHLDGDPDRPLIIGTVYNANQTVPYAQPDNKTRSTLKTNSSKGGDGFNELRFEDKAGEEEIYMHAQKDMNITVENDRTTEILNDETTTITKNRTVTIKEENESLTVEKGDRTVEISQGDESLTVGKGNRTIKVSTGNEDHTVQGNFSLTVNGDLTIDVKGKVTIKSGMDMLLDSGMKLTNKSGMDMTNDAGMNMNNKSGMNFTNEAGINLDNKASAMMTHKASAMGTVDGGGMLTVKGGLLKLG